MALFARRHYVWLADFVRPHPPGIAASLAKALYNEDNAFNPERFLIAAGQTPDYAKQVADVIRSQPNHAGNNAA